MPTQTELAQALKDAVAPTDRRDAALALLNATLSRDKIDKALAALGTEAVRDTLADDHRPVLRAKAKHYFDAPPDKDKGGNIREALIRLLVYIGNPADADLYVRGANTYYAQPVLDSTQTLRAASLAGLAAADPVLGAVYATKLLGEGDVSPFNCEPAMTAIEVLVGTNNVLPVYGFLLLRGVNGYCGEAVSKALKSLGANFPTDAYAALAKAFIEADSPDGCIGLIDHITETRAGELYPLLEEIISHTRHDDLHRYGAVMLAASRDPALVEALYRLAKFAPGPRVPAFIEAVELTTDDARDDLLDMLRRRL